MASKRPGITRLREQVDASKEDFKKKIFSQIDTAVKSYPNNWGSLADTDNPKSKTYFATIYNLFFDSFTETYKITSTELKKLYKEISDFTVKDIYDLTYKADGKTFDERMEEYWTEAKNKLNQRYSHEDVIQLLYHRYERLLETETRIIESKVKDNKKPVRASLIVIDSGCDTCIGGEFAIDEGVELPPYHPNCQCNWWYEETDNPDDIKDLDLEIEE